MNELIEEHNHISIVLGAIERLLIPQESSAETENNELVDSSTFIYQNNTNEFKMK